MKLLKFATVIFAIVFSLNASAAQYPVPIVNYDNIIVVVTSGQMATAEQVKQAIVTAAAAKNWSVAHQADGKLQATLNVRGKHSIAVEIAYAADKYSINYKDSTNMQYGLRDGKPVIHPYYNRWVQELREAIRAELLKL